MIPGSTGRHRALVAASALFLVSVLAADPGSSQPMPPGSPPAPSSALAADSSASPAPASIAAPPGAELDALRESVALLASRVDDLSSGSTAPPWAVALERKLDARIERLMEMQERLAARIETPLPRLDEPIILFTVAASTLVLGFVVGRGLQRRRDRRDGRFRL